MNEHSCVPKELHLRNWNVNFIKFSCLILFSSHLKIWKPFLAHALDTKSGGMDLACQPPDPRDEWQPLFTDWWMANPSPPFPVPRPSYLSIDNDQQPALRTRSVNRMGMLLQLLLRKAAAYKINTWKKSVAALYINSKLSKKNSENNPIYNSIKKKKILKDKFNQEVKEMYNENCRTLTKETEDERNKWKDTPCSWVRKINIIKMLISPKAIYRFIAIPVKILIAFWNR